MDAKKEWRKWRERGASTSAEVDRSRCRVALGGAVCLILFQFDVSIGLTSVLIKQQLYVYSWQARIVLCYLLREVKQISDRNGLCVSGDTNTGNIDSLVNSV